MDGWRDADRDRPYWRSQLAWAAISAPGPLHNGLPGRPGSEDLGHAEPLLARVRRVTVFGKAHHAWFVSVIDPGGVARSTVSAQLLGYARQVAEGQVRNRSV